MEFYKNALKIVMLDGTGIACVKLLDLAKNENLFPKTVNIERTSSLTEWVVWQIENVTNLK